MDDDLTAYRARLIATQTPRPPEPIHAGATDDVYNRLRDRWEEFKVKVHEPEATPDVDTLKTFFFWIARRSKGILSNHSSISTLCHQAGSFACMYRKEYGYEISEDDINRVRDHIASDIANELGLENKSHPKEFTDWEDIKMIIRFTILNDTYCFPNSRIRAQLICIFLLISDGGERLGAIVESNSYRNTNASIEYKDIQLFLCPGTEDAEPEFRLEITYNLRKGERMKPDKYLVQDYFTRRDDVPHCIVLWFLVLAFLNDAFEDVSAPLDLFSKRNLSQSDIPIPFKRSLMSTPIFRRVVNGTNEISPTLACRANSVTLMAKRVAEGAGLWQRFTFYNTRRGVSNAIADNRIPEGRRKQLMGHTEASDAVYRKYYQSKTFTVDTANIFRGETERKAKHGLLCMHLLHDPSPIIRKIPDSLRKECYESDKKLQDLHKLREELNKDDATYKDISKKIDSRQRSIRKRALTELQSTDRLNRSRERLRIASAPKEIQLPIMKPEAPIVRPELAKVLYPDHGASGSALAALQYLLDYCQLFPETLPRETTGGGLAVKIDERKGQKVTRKPGLGLGRPEGSENKTKPVTIRWVVTSEEHLAASEGLVASEIPVADEEHVAGEELVTGRSTVAVRRGRGRPTGSKNKPKLGIRNQQPRGPSIFNDNTVSNTNGTDKMSDIKGSSISSNLPNRMTPAEDDLLLHLRDSLCMQWKPIAERFPGRHESFLRRRYKTLALSTLTKIEAEQLVDIVENRCCFDWLQVKDYYPNGNIAHMRSLYNSLMVSDPRKKRVQPHDSETGMETIAHPPKRHKSVDNGEDVLRSRKSEFWIY